MNYNINIKDNKIIVSFKTISVIIHETKEIKDEVLNKLKGFSRFKDLYRFLQISDYIIETKS